LLDVLAAAYASAGLFDRASEAAQAALDLAPRSSIAAGIRERAGLYRQRKPYQLARP
jgi:regulator of sirC expression with transglutaminase-like and TPR domain